MIGGVRKKISLPFTDLIKLRVYVRNVNEGTLKEYISIDYMFASNVLLCFIRTKENSTVNDKFSEKLAK